MTHCVVLILQILRMIIPGDTMGYRVEYMEDSKKNSICLSTMRICVLTVLSFCLFTLLVESIWPDGFQCLQNAFCSINKFIPVSAMNEFAENLQNGEQLASAFSIFINNILP